MPLRDTPYSVSEFILEMNSRLSGLSAEILGEISELKIAASGHLYAQIKDKETGHVLPITMWRRDYALVGIQMEVGMEIVFSGKPEFYGPFGKLSFIARNASLVGEGALKLAYDNLKKKFVAEGLFSPERKRFMPEFPQKIGVITSLTGAVIHDFTNNLRPFGFQIRTLDCRVEGPESGRSLALSVRAMRREDIDVLVIIRGGGSMQSLAGYDNEALVREIVRFPVPVIAGLGHHTDVPLAALAADIERSTPSLVAALLNEQWVIARHSVGLSQQKIFSMYAAEINRSSRRLDRIFSIMRRRFDTIFGGYAESLRKIRAALTQIGSQISKDREHVEEMRRQSVFSYSERLSNIQRDFLPNIIKVIRSRFGAGLKIASRHLFSLTKLIDSNSPERQLRLGYSIVQNSGKLVRSTSGLKPGENLNIRVSDGQILTTIKTIK